MLGFIVSCEWIPDCTWLCGDDFIISPVCIIGMSLSKLHTSRTALERCVHTMLGFYYCILIACVLRMVSRLQLVEVVLCVDIKYLSRSSP